MFEKIKITLKRRVLLTKEFFQFWFNEKKVMKNKFPEVYGFAKLLIWMYIISLAIIMFLEDEVTLADYLINLNTETLGVLISSIIFFVILEISKKRERVLLDSQINSEFHFIILTYSQIFHFILDRIILEDNKNVNYFLEKNIDDLIELFEKEIPKKFDLENILYLMDLTHKSNQNTKKFLKLLNEEIHSDLIAFINYLLKNNKLFVKNKKAIQKTKKERNILYQYVPIDRYGPIDEKEFLAEMANLICSSLKNIQTIEHIFHEQDEFISDLYDSEYYNSLYGEKKENS